MAGKDDFSQDEWEELQKGVTGAGDARFCLPPRLHGQLWRGQLRVAKDLGAHRESASQLVRELAEAHGTGFGFAASPKEVEEGTLGALAASVALLHEKAPDGSTHIALSSSTSRTPSADAKGRPARRDGSDREDYRRARARVTSGTASWCLDDDGLARRPRDCVVDPLDDGQTCACGGAARVVRARTRIVPRRRRRARRACAVARRRRGGWRATSPRVFFAMCETTRLTPSRSSTTATFTQAAADPADGRQAAT